MGAGLHRENGLDPDTSIHLLQIYVIPILVYDLEVVLPTGVYLDTLDRIHKKFIKQILSLPENVADPDIYIIARALPAEAIIHTRTLSLFSSVSRLDESSFEKIVARRQLSIKAYGGNTWFDDIRRLCVKYNLLYPYTVLDCPPSKGQWKSAVHKAVYEYWVDNLKWRASFYSSLEFLCVSGYWPGQKHPLIQAIGCVRDSPRVHTKLKIVTGTYILQVNRVRFNQSEIDATCQICHQAEDTLLTLHLGLYSTRASKTTCPGCFTPYCL